MHGGGKGDYRVVIDDYGLDWRGRSDHHLTAMIDEFADLLEPLADGRHVAIIDHALDKECWESVRLWEVSHTRDRRVSHDARVRFARLLDKCQVIEPADEDIPQSVQLNGTPHEPSWGMAHALSRAAAGRAMSCLVGPAVSLPRGWVTVRRGAEQAELEVHLLADVAQLPEFWRGVFGRETIAEAAFFAIAPLAFPRLIFARSLSFRSFDGDYAEVLLWAVRLLALLDDHFAAALARHRGERNKVIAEFSAYGVNISPENSQTHQNAKAWAERLVSHDGTDYRCEWHGKRLFDRDRVHFSLPIPEREGKILIGIFTKHLTI